MNWTFLIHLFSFLICIFYVICNSLILSVDAQETNFRIESNGRIVDNLTVNESNIEKKIINFSENSLDNLNFSNWNPNVNVTAQENQKIEDIEQLNVLREGNTEAEFIEEPVLNETVSFQTFLNLNDMSIRTSPSIANEVSILQPLSSSLGELDLLFNHNIEESMTSEYNFTFETFDRYEFPFPVNYSPGTEAEPINGSSESSLQLSKNIGINASTCIDCTPPDTQIAAGRAHIVQVVNEYIGIFDKEGKPILNNLISNFFDFKNKSRVPLENVISTDPNLFYDFDKNRWFFSVLIFNDKEATPSNRYVFLATSVGSDPTQLWNYGLVPVRGNSNNECVDRPMMGVSKSQIIISSNLFYPNREGECREGIPHAVEVDLINKTDLITNQISGDTIHRLQFPKTISLMPVKSYGLDPAQCFISIGFSQSQTIWLRSLDKINNETVLSNKTILLQNLTYIPRTASQPDLNGIKSIALATGDARILDASYHNGKLWIVYNTSCKIDNDKPHTCIGMILLDNGKRDSNFHCTIDDLKLIDQKSIASKDVHYFFPSVQIDKNGNAIVLAGISSKSKGIFPSLNLLVISDDNGKIKINEDINLINGTHIADDSKNSECRYYSETISCNRMGDYSSTVLDPVDNALWTSGEFYRTENYSTVIAKIQTR
jgi:hypothetical protein